LPESIGNLVNLEILELNNNILNVLPDSIGNLTKLRILLLSHNRLNVLPESFGLLQNLNTLNLSKNLLRELPTSFALLVRLVDLYLRSNKITKINPNMENMPNLINYHIPITSYLIDNLDPNLEFLVINNLSKDLTNLPYGLKKIMLFNSKKTIKVPFGCKLYINGILQK
jgi:Leucine-rich repeat (LRR) protein